MSTATDPAGASLSLLAESAWTSLEAAKLVTSAVTPALILVLGVWVRRVFRAVELSHWLGQRQIEWRIKIYEDIAPKLNTLYCFMTYRGDFKEVEPPAVLVLKRDLDRRAAVYGPVLGAAFTREYARFMTDCFDAYQGKNRDARLRVGFASRKEAWGQQWQEAWEQLFADETRVTERAEIETAYSAVMGELAAGLSAPRG